MLGKTPDTELTADEILCISGGREEAPNYIDKIYLDYLAANTYV